MRWDENEQSSQVEDRRGRSSGGGRMVKGGGLGLLGTVAVLAIGYFLGIDPTPLLQGAGGSMQSAPGPAEPYQATPQEQQLFKFSSNVLFQTEQVWEQLFAASGSQYPKPKMVIYTGGTQTACGLGQAAAGPFYCPGDQSVYLDLSFYNELARQFGASGDFAWAYVIAHEVGHHVQQVTGTLGKANAAQRRLSEGEANEVQVRVELQADCYAGIWAHHAQKQRQILEEGDIEEAMRAAQAVGDDTIQKRAQGYVVPDAFTHGSAEQRQRWFMTGFRSGNPDSCDTFSAQRL
jgi:uncharacterized protein